MQDRLTLKKNRLQVFCILDRSKDTDKNNVLVKATAYASSQSFLAVRTSSNNQSVVQTLIL